MNPTIHAHPDSLAAFLDGAVAKAEAAARTALRLHAGGTPERLEHPPFESKAEWHAFHARIEEWLRRNEGRHLRRRRA